MLALLLALLLGACDGSPASTVILARFTFDQAALSISQLRITVQPEGAPAGEPRPAPETADQPLASGVTVALLLPEQWDGQTVQVEAVGLHQDAAVASGQIKEVVRGGKTQEVLIELSPLCQDSCEEDARSCQDDAFLVCRRDGRGCLSWSLPEACAAPTPYCSNGLCSSGCTHECQQQGERQCVAGTEGYRVCGQQDSDSCRDWSPPISCGPTELCREGQCVPSCDGQPCACSLGQTRPCADVGECRGGLSSCEGGEFGECVWAAGKSPEVCDGQDNDCNALVDDALSPQACAEQRGVCGGSRRSCAGSAGWLPCGASEYQAAAQAQGASYQADETLCDGQDNDCNGLVDEPTGCCQPACSGKACGADDGCGHPCASGSCPAHASCQGGTCLCDQLSCGSSCCAAGEVCTSAGLCATDTCQDVGPLIVDPNGEVGRYSSLAVDPAGKVHISYCEGVSSTCWELKYVTNASGSWQEQFVDRQGDVGQDSSLGLDAAGKVHISYHDKTAGDLKYATNVSGSWQTQVLDAAGTVGLGTSLAVDAAGKVHISYHDLSNTALKYATNAAGSWQTVTVDDAGYVGEYSSLGIDAAGKVHISYFDRSNTTLKVATNAAGSWQTVTVDPAAGVGWGPSLGVDAAGKVHISYEDYTSSDLKYATNAAGSWQITTIDAAGIVGRGSSLGLDAAGKVHISYEDLTNNLVKIATNASGHWQTFAAISSHFVGSGSRASLGLDQAGVIHLSTFDKTSYHLQYLALCP